MHKNLPLNRLYIKNLIGSIMWAQYSSTLQLIIKFSDNKQKCYENNSFFTKILSSFYAASLDFICVLQFLLALKRLFGWINILCPTRMRTPERYRPNVVTQANTPKCRAWSCNERPNMGRHALNCRTWSGNELCTPKCQTLYVCNERPNTIQHTPKWERNAFYVLILLLVTVTAILASRRSKYAFRTSLPDLAVSMNFDTLITKLAVFFSVRAVVSQERFCISSPQL